MNWLCRSYGALTEEPPINYNMSLLAKLNRVHAG